MIRVVIIMSSITNYLDGNGVGRDDVAHQYSEVDDVTVRLRVPTADDGIALHRLIAACPPLDTNSRYCNLLHCTHFRATSVAARLANELVGFVSAYPLPQHPDTLFVWQVAVADKMRGRGLGRRMVRHALGRSVDFRYLETSITPTNKASWSLFESVARELGAELQHIAWFERERHFDNQSEDELLVRIGPF